MKSKEQIQFRIDELEKVKNKGDYEVEYLKIALVKNENELKNLLSRYEMTIRKLNYELDEDIKIVKALS